MNNLYSAFIFYPVVILIVVFVLLTIKLHNIFYSLLSAIMVFFLTGVVFYLLGAEYNAVIQILVYGIAVPIIIGLGIMFTDTKNEKQTTSKEINYRYIIYLFCGIFVLALIYLYLMSNVVVPAGFNVSEDVLCENVNIFDIFCKNLSGKYAIAMQMLAVLSVIVITGISLLKKEGRLR